MMKTNLSLFLCLLLLAISARVEAQTTRYVMPSASGSGNGSDWANASNDLQTIITASASGDAIWVAAGTYKPTQDPFGNTNPGNPRDKSFYLKDGVKVYGGFFGDETTLGARHGAASVLSGDLNGDDTPNFGNNVDNTYHIVISVSDGNATIFDGFTVTGANGNGSGAIVVETKNCNRNIGTFDNEFSSPTINNCIFINNKQGFGGGMSNFQSSPIVTNSTFIGNSILNDGGGMFNYTSSPQVSNCSFHANISSTGGGAGLYNYDNSNSTIINCTFSENSASYTGGAMWNYTSNPTIKNCTFSGNYSNTDGGAMSNFFASPAIMNCIIWGNTSAGVANLHDGSPVVTYSIVEGGYAGTGNSSANPLFVNLSLPSGADNTWRTADDGLSIQSSSPAINAGTTSGAPSTDITGNNRTGNPDMGAYEAVVCPTRLYVTTTGTGDGSSWANAMSNLQAAINNTCGVTEIWVAAGTYKPTQDPSGNTSPTDPQDKTFYLKDGVKVYGGFFGDETTLGTRHGAASILSGDFNDDDVVNGTGSSLSITGNGENAYHVVLSVSDANTTRLDGFTIKSGNADGSGAITVESISISNGNGGAVYATNSSIVFENNIITKSSANGGGGLFGDFSNLTITNSTLSLNNETGMRCVGGTPTITNCNFTGNAAVNYGAGLWNYISSPIITGCTFTGNYSSGFGFGAGIYNQSNSDAVVTNCTFTNNVSAGSGGAIRNEDSSPSYTACTFEGNSAQVRGGAINNIGYNNTSMIPITFTNCIFSGNTCTPQQGGAVSNHMGVLNYTNCVFTGNSASEGGAVFNIDITTVVGFTNCTFSGNNAGDGGAIYNWGATPVIKNCIIWGNTASANNSISDNSGASSNVTYSTVEGGYAGTGNIATNPMFVNAADPNGADNTWRTADDGLMIGCGTTAANAGTSTGTPALDILGNAIFGAGKDMGAYESPNDLSVPAPPTITPSTATTVCAGVSVTLTSSIAAEYAWYKNGSFVKYSNTSPDYTFNASAGTSNYTLVAIVPGGYCPSSQSTSISVTGNAPTAMITPSIAPPYCLNTPPVLNASPTGIGYTYSWIGSSPSAATATANNFTPTTSGNHRVIVTDPIGCSKSSLWSSIALNALPGANAGVDKSVCINSGSTIGVTAIAGMSYSWTPSTDLSSTTISNPTVSPSAINSVTYTLTMTNNTTGCYKTDEVVIAGAVIPATPTLASTTSPVCQGTSITLTPSGVTGPIHWYKNGVLMTAAATAAPLAVGAASATAINYTIRANNGTCLSNPSNTASVWVQSAPTPTLSASPAIVGSTVSICNGQENGTVVLTANLPGGSPTPAMYNWQQYAGGVPTNLAPMVTTSSYTASVSAAPAIQNNKVFRAQVTYTNGCVKNSANVTVKLLPVNCSGRMGQDDNLVTEVFTAYPNPTAGTLHVLIENSLASDGTLSVYNALGQIVTSRTITLHAGRSEEMLDISNLVSGIYTLSFQTKDGNKVQKIVKQ